MTTRKAGLHKDVATIFDGVWNPETDNFRQLTNAGLQEDAFTLTPKAYIPEKLLKEVEVDNKIQSKTKSRNFKAPRSRRERKRLSSISRNLIINLDN